MLARSTDRYGIFHKHGAYPATRFDAEMVATGAVPPVDPLLVAGGVVDLPLSVAFDTLLLPYDLAQDAATH